MQKANIKWDELGFSYQYVDNMYVSYWKDGKWDEGKIQDGDRISISIGATALHYGQECFEGLKAYSTKDGEIQLFRPDMNAKRLQDSCERLLMPEIPVEKFIDACKQVVKANEKYVPPYGTGATYYIRPFVIGCGDNIGVGPAPEYLFCVFGIPVGPYFKGGFKPVSMTTAKYDRAAPYGTGAAKVGGNYAGSMLPHKLANEEGYSDCIYLDPATHTKIEEAGAANFFGITKDNKFITPDSPSILPTLNIPCGVSLSTSLKLVFFVEFELLSPLLFTVVSSLKFLVSFPILVLVNVSVKSMVLSGSIFINALLYSWL